MFDPNLLCVPWFSWSCKKYSSLSAKGGERFVEISVVSSPAEMAQAGALNGADWRARISCTKLTKAFWFSALLFSFHYSCF